MISLILLAILCSREKRRSVQGEGHIRAQIVLDGKGDMWAAKRRDYVSQTRGSEYAGVNGVFFVLEHPLHLVSVHVGP